MKTLKKIRINNFSLIILIMLLLTACSKNENLFPEKVKLRVNIKHFVDSASLDFDTISYVNAAGNNFEITRLEYYISDIVLHSDFLGDYASPGIFYVSPNLPQYTSFVLADVPSGQYNSISFKIGISPDQNISYSLPNTAENISMAWPDMMGGGYHFLKLEGHYIHNSIPEGFAVHLGSNNYYSSCSITKDFFIGYSPYQINLEMDINEWFKSPHIYDLQSDGSYTMGDTLLMRKIKENGFNVFELN